VGAAAVFDPPHELAGRLGHTARQRGIDGEGLGHLVHSQHLLVSVLVDELAEQGWNVKRAAPLCYARGVMATPDTGGPGLAPRTPAGPMSRTPTAGNSGAGPRYTQEREERMNG
jgi:hypothetical protein